jgi:DDE domain
MISTELATSLLMMPSIILCGWSAYGTCGHLSRVTRFTLPVGATSYETVRRWVRYFEPTIAADLRRRRPKPHSTWHLDEVFIRIDGRLVYLWRAVDAEGEVLDVHVQSKRDNRAALKLMRKLLKKMRFAGQACDRRSAILRRGRA